MLNEECLEPVCTVCTWTVACSQFLEFLVLVTQPPPPPLRASPPPLGLWNRAHLLPTPNITPNQVPKTASSGNVVSATIRSWNPGDFPGAAARGLPACGGRWGWTHRDRKQGKADTGRALFPAGGTQVFRPLTRKACISIRKPDSPAREPLSATRRATDRLGQQPERMAVQGFVNERAHHM